jgi:hypothetical protein
MRTFTILPALALYVSSVSASQWGIDTYTSKSCISAHSASSFGDSVAESCASLLSAKKLHGIQGSGLGSTWHVKVYSGEDCTGSEGTLVTNNCEDNQNLFGDGTTLTMKSFKVCLLQNEYICIFLTIKKKVVKV